MKTSMCLIILLVIVGFTYASVEDIGGLAHGGEGVGAKELGVGGRGGAGYGGRKGGVQSTGYDRSFSYGTGHDTGKSVSVEDQEMGGKGFGDKGLRELGVAELGYGGQGYGGYRVPVPMFFLG